MTKPDNALSRALMPAVSRPVDTKSTAAGRRSPRSRPPKVMLPLVLAVFLLGCADNPVRYDRDLSIAGAWKFEVEALGLTSILILEESGDFARFATDGKHFYIERGTWYTRDEKLRLAMAYGGQQLEDYILDGDRLRIGVYWWDRLEIVKESPWSQPVDTLGIRPRPPAPWQSAARILIF